MHDVQVHSFQGRALARCSCTSLETPTRWGDKADVIAKGDGLAHLAEAWRSGSRTLSLNGQYVDQIVAQHVAQFRVVKSTDSGFVMDLSKEGRVPGCPECTGMLEVDYSSTSVLGEFFDMQVKCSNGHEYFGTLDALTMLYLDHKV